MSPQLEELVIEHALTALSKQMRFDALLGRHEWRWENESGLLMVRRLDADEAALTCATQALGSVSRMSETWTWIWANDLAEISEGLMTAARQLRAIGKGKNVPEFTTGEFPREQVNAHLLALVAMGLLEADAYFRGSYLGGEGFVLINRGELNAVLPATPTTADEVLKVVPEVDALCSNHRRAIAAYLRRIGWSIEEENETLVACQGDEQIRLIFDAANRLGSYKNPER